MDLSHKQKNSLTNSLSGDTDDKDSRGRRGFIRSFLGAASGSLFLIWGCKTKSGEKSKKESLGKPSVSTLSESSGGPVEGSQDMSEVGGQIATEKSTDHPTTSGQCSQEVKIDLASLQDVTENYEVSHKLYGSALSGMLVIWLPKFQYEGGSLSSVIVVRSNGEAICQKGILESSDVREDTTLRPLIFDNLRIGGDKALSIVFKIGCEGCEEQVSYKKYDIINGLNYETKRNKKIVYSISPFSVPKGWAEHQAMPTISTKVASNDSPGGSDEQGYMYRFSSSLLRVDNLKAFEVTDLTGRVLSPVGQDLSVDMFEHPVVICYKLVNNMFYVRTIVRFI